jgi:hypothetical protein
LARIGREDSKEVGILEDAGNREWWAFRRSEVDSSKLLLVLTNARRRLTGGE